MLINWVQHKHPTFRRVPMDTGNGVRNPTLVIEHLEKISYCPLRANVQVGTSGATSSYLRINLPRSDVSGLGHRITVRIEGYPKDQKGTPFRVDSPKHCTHRLVSNGHILGYSHAIQEDCALCCSVGLLQLAAKRRVIRDPQTYGAALGWVSESIPRMPILERGPLLVDAVPLDGRLHKVKLFCRGHLSGGESCICVPPFASLLAVFRPDAARISLPLKAPVAFVKNGRKLFIRG